MAFGLKQGPFEWMREYLTLDIRFGCDPPTVNQKMIAPEMNVIGPVFLAAMETGFALSLRKVPY